MDYVDDTVEFLENGFRDWYPNAKVYNDGENYIAIPHTPNYSKRKRRNRQEQICVSQDEDGKFKLEKKFNAYDYLIPLDDDIECPFDDIEQTQPTLEEVVALEKARLKRLNNEPVTHPVKKRTTTRKVIFEELYEKYSNLDWSEMRDAIYKDMLPLFKNEESAKSFMLNNWARKCRNAADRRRRFKRKAFNFKDFNYFVTLTYEDGKFTAKTFLKSVKKKLENETARRGWQYLCVVERGKENGRIHIHGLFYIPEGMMIGELFQKTDYSLRKHKMQTITMNSYFFKKYGRNEFEALETGPQYNDAVDYISKYIGKSPERTMQSKGIYQYFFSDIYGGDVVCKLKPRDESDNKLVLAPNFTCWDEGCKVGTVGKETIAQLRKSG